MQESLDNDESSIISREAKFVLIGAMIVLVVNITVCIKARVLSGVGRLIESFMIDRCLPLWEIIIKTLAFIGIRSEEHQEDNFQRHPTEVCTLCIGDFANPVVATCGHVYCGKCIIDYWESKLREQIGCPLCRRPISMLLKDSIGSIEAGENAEQANEYVLNGIRHYNLRYSKRPRSMIQVFLDTPFLLSRFCDFIRTREGVLFFLRRILGSIYIIFFLIYILSPLDLIPDVIPFIGYLDDMIVAAFILVQITVIYFNYLRSNPQ